jgi:hypothetical protein
MKYNTTFFVELVVPDLVEHVCQENRQKTLQGIMVHLDDARPHNSRKSEAALTATKARKIPASVYSSPNELISAISELIVSLPKGQFAGVYENWMKRINWVIKHRGEYYRG